MRTCLVVGSPWVQALTVHAAEVLVSVKNRLNHVKTRLRHDNIKLK